MVTLAISHHFPKRLELAWRKCNFKRLIPHFHSQEKKFLMAYLSTPLGINLDMLTLHNSYNHSTITSSFSSSFDDLFGRFDTPKRMSLAMVTYPLSTHTVAKLNFLSIKYFTKKSNFWTKIGILPQCVVQSLFSDSNLFIADSTWWNSGRGLENLQHPNAFRVLCSLAHWRKWSITKGALLCGHESRL